MGTGQGGRGRGVPAPHAPLYTVGGARRPLLPVLKYCSLTDMALTMGPEMRGGGVPSNPPMLEHTGQPWGTPVPRDWGWGSCGQGAWLCALGLAQGRMGQGDGSAGDDGKREEACRGPLGEAGGAGGTGSHPGGAGRAWSAPSLPRGCVSAFGPGSLCPARAAPLWHSVVGGPCLDRTGRVFSLVRGMGRRGWGGGVGTPVGAKGT